MELDQTATTAMLHGIHPYTVRAPDLQHGGFDFGSTPTVYPYMPLTLVAAAPWVALLRDYRFGIACCLPITILLIRRAGRVLRVDDAHLDLLTVALVLHPAAPEMAGIGYLEPLLVVTAAAFVLLAATERRGGFGEATASCSCRQSSKCDRACPAVCGHARARKIGRGGSRYRRGDRRAVRLWRWRPTIDGILFFVRVPLRFRTDSDSLATLLFALTGIESPRSIPIVVQFVAAAVAYRRVRNRGLEGLLLASALSLLSSFLVAPQAFTKTTTFSQPHYYCFQHSPPRVAREPHDAGYPAIAGRGRRDADRARRGLRRLSRGVLPGSSPLGPVQ